MIDKSSLIKSGQLYRRYHLLYEQMKFCKLCPRNCKINRYRYNGVCGANYKIRIANALLHFGEEPPLVKDGGSGAIFFSGCPMKCIYCQNMGFSQKGLGFEVTEQELAFIMLELQKAGAENINLITASHYTPQVLKALEIALMEGLSIPIVWNTSSYEKVETLKFLDGVVDVYLADIRYVEDVVGLKYSKVPNYWTVAKKALKEMFKQVGAFDGERGIIVRILVLPSRVTDHKKALDFVANELSPDVPVSIMRQYMPVFDAKSDPLIGREVSEEEYEEVLSYAERLGIHGWMQLDVRQDVSTKAVESIHKLLKSKAIGSYLI